MFNNLNNLRTTLLLLAVAFRLPAADPTKSVAKAMAESISLQRKAVSSMAAPLAAQRRSVRRQASRLPALSGFTLPPLPPGPPVPLWDTPPCPPLPAFELEGLVYDAAQREEVEPDLIRSVIHQESAARPCAVSAKGAIGLMQLMPATALQLGISDPFDPKQNVDAGTRFLGELLKLYGGDVSLALGAFNAGPGKVNQASGLPGYPETLDYVQKVLSPLLEHH